MFVRVKQNKNKEVVQIVESIRKRGLPKQKILRHVGTAHTPKELEKLKELAYYIITEIKNKREPQIFNFNTLPLPSQSSQHKYQLYVDLNKLTEQQRIITGIHEIYGNLYKEIGYDLIFKQQKISKDIIRDLALARLSIPKSKKATVELLKETFGINYKLEQIYRALDILKDKKIEQIKTKTYSYTKTLFEQQISLIFYDCTTLYFESFTQDELKSYGYSKDNKFNQSQIVMALAVTKEGLPVYYEIFSGNFYEGYTLKIVIDKLQEKLKIKRMILVADSGLFNKTNLEYLEQNKIEFIVGARLKNLSKTWQSKILDSRDFIKINQKEDVLRLFDYQYSNTIRLIVSHSAKRAEKDKKERDKSIEKLQKRIQKTSNAKNLISNFGYQKYLKIEGESHISIDDQKLEHASQWDGLHGVFTNVKDLKAQELLEQYHGLWQVEESFRINKNDLLIRPIFHWTARRIKSHIAIVFISFSLIRFMQYKLQKSGLKLSAEKISKELNNRQISILKHLTENSYYAIPSKPTDTLKKIYLEFNKKPLVTPYKIDI